MKKILVLGAGLVSKPLVEYLLKISDYYVTLVDKIIERAEEIIGKSTNGMAMGFDANNGEELERIIKESDIVVSLLPWFLHERVAKVCIKHCKNMVTTSYVNPHIKLLEEEVKDKGILFLNEIGVDPGIDHMMAMKEINEIHKNNGKVIDFKSFGTSLPAHQSNNNPMGYKFSWSPIGFLLGSLNDGYYMKNKEVVEIKEKDLFKEYFLQSIPQEGIFEAFVNRDAIKYVDLYGIHYVENIFRGSLRHIGFCDSWQYFKMLGLLNRDICFDFRKMSPGQVLANIIKSEGKNLVGDICEYLKIPKYSITIKKLEWLGLFSDELLPLERVSVFEMFCYILERKLRYEQNEMDMIILHQEIISEYPDKSKTKKMSTLVSKGYPLGVSATSYTVSIPAAIAVKLILERKINLTGIQIPVHSQIYIPVLKELNDLNINIHERYFNI